MKMCLLYSILFMTINASVLAAAALEDPSTITVHVYVRERQEKLAALSVPADETLGQFKHRLYTLMRASLEQPILNMHLRVGARIWTECDDLRVLNKLGFAHNCIATIIPCAQVPSYDSVGD